MSFFSSNPDQSPRQEQSSRPLFQQPFAGGDPESHVSLSAYISKHFQEGEEKESPEQKAPVSRFQPPAIPSAYNSEEAPSGRQGHFLNQVDVEFTAGLEQYMPTPLFRLRVTKKRLDIEIAELKMRLNKYERLLNTGAAPATDDLSERMIHIRERIGVLEAHEKQVSLELQALLTYGPAFYNMAKGAQTLQNAADTVLNAVQTGLKKALFGEKKLKIESKSQELLTLQDVLSERMADRNTSPGEISQLINQYEQAIREMEQLTAHLQQGSGFRQFIR